MAGHDRWRNDRDVMREGDEDRRRREAGSRPYRPEGSGFAARGRLEDDRGDGTIARRGFGHDSAGYDDSNASHTGRGRDAAGYRGSDYDSPGHRDWGLPARRRPQPDDDERHARSYEHRDAFRGRHDDGIMGRDRYSGSGSDGDRGFWRNAVDEVGSWFAGDEFDSRETGPSDRSGLHRGRGPRSYVRSDARILEDVNDRLTDDPHLDASEIEVRVENREVTLAGTVASRFEKRHAEDIAESVSGVTHVQNNLRVQQTGAATGGGAATGSGTTGIGGPDMGSPRSAGSSGAAVPSGPKAGRRGGGSSGL